GCREKEKQGRVPIVHRPAHPALDAVYRTRAVEDTQSAVIVNAEVHRMRRDVPGESDGKGDDQQTGSWLQVKEFSRGLRGLRGLRTEPKCIPKIRVIRG